MLPEFMNLLRKFYFMRAAARSIKIEYCFFDKLRHNEKLIVPEAVEKLRFPNSLSLETTLSSEAEEKNTANPKEQKRHAKGVPFRIP